eukprot:1545429-Pleurochrysis_carterae.AAC.4
MLMDMLYAHTSARPRLRVHFHAFMLDVHSRLHAVHQSRPRSIVLTEQGLPIYKFGDAYDTGISDGTSEGGPDPKPRAQPHADGRTDETEMQASVGGERSDQTAVDTGAAATRAREPDDPLMLVVKSIAAEASLLCLDEMQERACFPTDQPLQLTLRLVFKHFGVHKLIKLVSQHVASPVLTHTEVAPCGQASQKRQFHIFYMEALSPSSDLCQPPAALALLSDSAHGMHR